MPFPAGARVVMYTDGLVERRDRAFDAGIAEMITVLSAAGNPTDPNQMIDVLIDALIGDDDHTDDIAVLVSDNTLPAKPVRSMGSQTTPDHSGEDRNGAGGVFEQVAQSHRDASC